ncbi:MAG: hypothetical protein HKO93_06015, partial [Flavobacteriales bacterium]|nr:hypothetical protein [Flavobacteriales bacterium]
MSGQKSNIITVEDLRTVQKFLGKNWYLLLLIPLFFALVAYFYTHRLPEIYGAKTEILLKSGEEYDYQSQVYSSLAGFYSNYADITNQKRVLTSYDLVSKVLEKLDFDITFYVVGRVKTIPGTSLEPVDVDIEILNDRLYGKRIDFRILDTESYELSYEMGDENRSSIHNFDKEEISEAYRIKVNKKNGFYEEDISDLVRNHYQIEVNDINRLVSKFRSNLAIENVQYTSILAVTLENELEDRAKVFLDTLASVYIDYTIEKQIQLNDNTIQYIDLQISSVQEILDSIETEMELYMAANAILDLKREEEKYFNELVKYETSVKSLELQLEALSALEEYLERSTEEKLLPPAIYILDDDFLDKSLNALYNFQFGMDQELFDVTEDNIGIKQEEVRIDSMRTDLLTYIDNSRFAIKGRIGDISNTIAEYEYKIRSIPGSQRDLVEINRKLKVNEKMYTFLLEKRANTVIAKAAIIPQTSVIEKSRSVGLVAPDKERILLMFIGSGMILALFIAFIRLIFYERIENTRELKEATDIPIIGGIPKSAKAEETRLVVDLAPKSNIAEAFRSIRTSVQYMNPDHDVSTMLVTSLHPGEGKTFCTANIATIFSKAGKKVLVLDFDLHKPKVHQTFEMDNSVGLSTYLIGRIGWRECLMSSGIENLDVITSGPVPPNPSELV